MVSSGGSEGEGQQKKFKTMAPHRSKPLHNFSMPCLKWGNQRLLRCMKTNSNGEIYSADRRSSASEAESEGLISRRRESESGKLRSSSGSESFKKSPLPPIGASGRKSKIERDGDDGIEGVRKKLIFDLRTAADKMKAAIVDEGEEEELSAAVARPWNLRRRRAACRSPNEIKGGGGLMNEVRQQNSSPPRTGNPTITSLRPRGLAAAQGAEKKEPCKFSISLSREEIKDDFLLMMGTRPSRRPKKRAKIVQKQLDSIFPGLWISEITPDSYEVPEFPESGKM